MIPYMKRVMNLQIIGGRDASNSEGGEQQIGKKSTRERRQPDYLKDYTVQLYHCTVTSCFFIGTSNEEEPARYEEAKGCPEWEAAIQEEIEALHKNETWELVPKFRFSTVSSGSLLLRDR